jgi:hypothetical protein
MRAAALEPEVDWEGIALRHGCLVEGSLVVYSRGGTTIYLVEAE